ncbi:MAG: 3-phosphoshikimate 1-carboxyvinyltransferase [Chloroflexi bacterium]|nr:3-phosphoshikimate 1-carboxyvinyltransferase [Chloroflexota bacterium]
MRIVPAQELTGEVVVPGDKSIAHRALLLGALADGVTRVANVPDSDDLAATKRCLEALGVPIVRNGGGALHVTGGRIGEAAAPLDCGGSGTTIRLIAGLLAGLPFTSILSANAQLAKRPMGRIIDPLKLMGADISPLPPPATPNGRQAMLIIKGGGLHAIEYATPVASAQVKSAVLLAALHASGHTTVRESAATRDHTERMLRAMGAQITHDRETNTIMLSPSHLSALNISVPNDFSSAAFFIAAGLLAPRADLLIKAVNLNPTRTGLLDIITAMGGAVAVEQGHEENGEPVGDLRVRTVAGLRGATVGGAVVPRAIDEFPLVALLATQAEGETLVRDAAELRVKESDRVSAVAVELRKLGAQIEERPDGFVVRGRTPLHGAEVDSHGDHRLAMMLAVAGLIASGETRISGAESVAKSFPEFERVLAGITR